MILPQWVWLPVELQRFYLAGLKRAAADVRTALSSRTSLVPSARGFATGNITTAQV